MRAPLERAERACPFAALFEFSTGVRTASQLMMLTNLTFLMLNQRYLLLKTGRGFIFCCVCVRKIQGLLAFSLFESDASTDNVLGRFFIFVNVVLYRRGGFRYERRARVCARVWVQKNTRRFWESGVR
jgi:hypothetical protein